jgi:hypothetical protein
MDTLVDGFIDKINDEDELDQVAYVAYSSTERATEPATRGEVAATTAVAMQLQVAAQQDADERIEEAERRIAILEAKLAEAMAILRQADAHGKLIETP